MKKQEPVKLNLYSKVCLYIIFASIGAIIFMLLGR